MYFSLCRIVFAEKMVEQWCARFSTVKRGENLTRKKNQKKKKKFVGASGTSIFKRQNRSRFPFGGG
jgi:hypothetical protein